MREHGMPGEVIRLAEDVIRLDGDVIRLDGVTKTYQAGAPPAVAEVSMSVAAREVVAMAAYRCASAWSWVTSTSVPA